jgi:hypothetical protein
MGKLIINMQMSLDRVMQGPGGPDEDPSGGFQQGGWAMPYFDESMLEASSSGMASAGGSGPGSPHLRHLRRVLAPPN